MVAFVKRVDLEIPDNRITEALTKVGLDVINVTRLNRKHGNIPTCTIKITFKDANNRNTFIHTALHVDSMYFNAEAASQNKKSKYCKTKQQVCAKCGDNHRIEQCTAANDAIKCNNCKVETLINDDIISSSSFSNSDEDIQIVNNNNNNNHKPKKQNNKPTTTSAVTTAKPKTTTKKISTQSSITTNDSIKKPTPKPKPTAKTSKRN
ncbi:unnamed protein product [Rotaria magnacalcarata]|uniref:Uncharacterized protein n=1 Tax=Rotaria magnacalcarata TaxID=392030 RepID=A0A8S3GK49_9BILA|nr:unnamed protein product [Rotaria magnacalcarata]CAF5167694.1 unnamed protein product [Rotaria magnacalcarata]